MRQTVLTIAVVAVSALPPAGEPGSAQGPGAGGRFQTLGEGRVATYDNELHAKLWYYFIAPGTVFDLKSKRALKPDEALRVAPPCAR